MELLVESQQTTQRRRRFTSHLATSQSDIRESQGLRYLVFGLEMGASMPYTDRGVDRDEFDDHCDHLLVRESDTGKLVGSYRILEGTKAARIGRFYSETEFELGEILSLRLRTVEVGRACVHPDHRRGAVIAQLWAGLAEYVVGRGYEYVIGCTSIPIFGDGREAIKACRYAAKEYLSPAQWRVLPRCPFPAGGAETDGDPVLPALLKGYLRLGAWVCGEPAWDKAFHTADLFTMLQVARMNSRYFNRFVTNA